MTRDRRSYACAAAIVLSLATPRAVLAADAGPPPPQRPTQASASAQRPSAAGSASAAGVTAVASAAPESSLGHAANHGVGAPTGPLTDTEDDDAAAPANPHAHGGQDHGGGGEMFQAPEDGSMDDPTLPVGTLDIHIVDPTGKPLPNATVTLGILYNSIAKGDSKKRLTFTTNDSGIARVEHLETGSAVAYRPMVLTENATFSVMPFRMPDKIGTRALLHVYPVVEDITAALVVAQSILFTEVKDDRIQIQQAFKIYNFGKNAWVPKDLVVTLPETFTAFTSQQGMTDIGVDAIPGKGVKIHGTFGPGQHMVEFRWQLPYAGESEVRFEVGMTPRLAAARVIAPASRDMKLDVPGFPPPQSSTDELGQRSLITEKQLRKDEPPLTNVSVVIRGLPTEGPAKVIATLLAAGALVFGIVLGTQKPSSRHRKAARAKLLAELEDLERARLRGDVGPKTHAKARAQLLEAIARTFAEDSPARVVPARRRAA